MLKNDFYLIKLKSAGRSDVEISEKMGISIDEVKKCWDRLVQDYECSSKNGTVAYVEAFTNLCSQYQLLGESLKILALAFEEATEEELQSATKGMVGKDQILSAIKSNFMVLRPFRPITPEESLKKTIAGN